MDKDEQIKELQAEVKRLKFENLASAARLFNQERNAREAAEAKVEELMRIAESSVDAAIELVPDGHSWNVGNCGPDDQPWACVTSPLAADEAGGCNDFDATAATPALALTAAAIRALAAGGAQLETCDACNGSGVGVADTVCSKCNGSGGIAAGEVQHG